jgi:transcriptional regulator PpsR
MPGDRIAFRDLKRVADGFGAEALAHLAEQVHDIAVVLDSDGRVIDAAFSNGDPTRSGSDGWIGRDWSDLVNVESKPKIAEMLAAAAAGDVPRWRQVNHPTNDGDVPVRWLAFGSGSAGAERRVLAVGQDMRASAVLQQRLIQTQQSLERDYLRLRQAEARYRMLFDLDQGAVLIVDADARRIREANPAATELAGLKPGALVNRALTSLFHADDHETLVAHLGMAAASDKVAPVTIRLAKSRRPVTVSATAFRQDRQALFLVRAAVEGAAQTAESPTLRDLVDYLPDAIVLTDARRTIVSANTAFVDMTEEVSAARLTGADLGDYIGRVGIDLDVIVEQVRQHGSARNVATILRSRSGLTDEVEVSAVAAPTSSDPQRRPSRSRPAAAAQGPAAFGRTAHRTRWADVAQGHCARVD